MDLIQLMTNNGIPLLSSLLLGVLLSVCPCTMAANVTALTCMLRQKESNFLSLSFSYILSRALAYTLVALLLRHFVDGVEVTRELIELLGKIAGPLFLIIGVLLLDIVHIHGVENVVLKRMNEFLGGKYSMIGSFSLGLLLAFAFCPYSAAIYFGVMLPLSCSVSYGAILPLVFSVGASLPLAIIAFLMNKGVSDGIVKSRLETAERWYRRVIAAVFIITGILFMWEYYLE